MKTEYYNIFSRLVLKNSGKRRVVYKLAQKKLSNVTQYIDKLLLKKLWNVLPTNFYEYSDFDYFFFAQTYICTILQSYMHNTSVIY